jgi:putative MATE family efflux protein
MQADKSYISYRNIFSIALPIMVGSFANNIINVVDTALLGRVGQVELGAGAIGGIFYFILIMIGFGFNTGMQIIVARRVGEGKPEEVGRIFRHHVVILAAYALVAFITLRFFGDAILDFLISSNDVQHASSSFILYRSYGVFFGLANACFLSFYIGIGRTRIANYTTLTLALINGLLAYAFIFGRWGFPEMGIAGAGLASSIAEALVTVIYIVYTLRAGFAQQYGLTVKVPWDNALVKSMMALSYPLVFQYMLTIVTWFAFFVIIENLGEEPLAVSNVVKAIYIFWGIPTWALGSTANTMVSNLIGQGKSDLVKTTIRKICSFNFLLMVFLCALMWLFMNPVISLFTSDAALFEDVKRIMPTIIIALLVFSNAFVVLLAVSGTGSSRMSFLIELTSISLYTVFAWLTARVWLQPLSIIWGAEILYWVLTLSLGLLYFRYGNWVKKV